MPARSGTIDRSIVSQFMALSTPNVSDALDRLQINGAPQGILPLYACSKIVGPAATLKLVPVSAAKESAVLGTLEAVKLGDPGAVLVIDCSENPKVNCYGGIAGSTTKHYGFVGCVADGVVRDIDEYKGYGLPVYGKGIVQQSIRGQGGEHIVTILGLDQRQGLQHDQECLGWMVGEFERSADVGQGARPRIPTNSAAR